MSHRHGARGPTPRPSPSSRKWRSTTSARRFAALLQKGGPARRKARAVVGRLCIELLLKALLLHRTDQFPATHDLARLRRLLEHAAPEIKFTDEGRSVLSRINKFFSLRYPAPGGAEPLGTEDVIPLRNLADALVAAFPPQLHQEFAAKLKKGERVLWRKPINPAGAA